MKRSKEELLQHAALSRLKAKHASPRYQRVHLEVAATVEALALAALPVHIPARELSMHSCKDGMTEALSLVQSALALLDDAPDAFDVAAHLNLAIERLREKVEAENPCLSAQLCSERVSAAA